MQKFMSARMVALVLVAGGLAACSGAESDKSAANQPAEKPAVVASIDAQSDVAGGLGGDEPLDRLKEVPGELGKSLGRVMDTITKPVKKAFAPRVESKEMERNSKAQFILHAKKKERKLINRIKKIDPSLKLLSPVVAKIIKYDIFKTIDDELQYKVLVKLEYEEVGGVSPVKHKTTSIWRIVAVRKPIIKNNGKIVYPELIIRASAGSTSVSTLKAHSLIESEEQEFLEKLAEKYL